MLRILGGILNTSNKLANQPYSGSERKSSFGLPSPIRSFKKALMGMSLNDTQSTRAAITFDKRKGEDGQGRLSTIHLQSQEEEMMIK